MPSFKDANGREWLVTVDVAQIRRVRQRLKLNLADLQEGDLLLRLADPVTLVDVLFVLVLPQAEEKNVSDEQFASALGGDTLTEATTALLEALCDFFQEPQRTFLRMVLAATKRKQAEAMTLLETEGDKLIQTMLERAMNTKTVQARSPTGD
ncbi:MAG: hypothetical protein DCC68_05060 [Planctomycetota bacterium]|nr:MAG: hypothetical protein DCC68_05060 [Planctomycetota bacterium]